jgi:uncharacterized protein YjiS (DUF1127 family)
MVRLITEPVKAVASFRCRRATVRELSSLDDRMLKDIGISRCQIASVATSFHPRRR